MLEGLSRAVFTGVGATVVLDLWILLLKRRGVPALDFALLGRWVGSFSRGRFVHRRISDAAPVRGEVALGWAAHYATGIAFAAFAIAVLGPQWARDPALLPALLVGIGTVAAPLFIMQPAMGAGIASSRTPAPLLNSLKSVVNHTIFGAGLYLAARASAALLR